MGAEEPAAERVRLARQLAETREAFRDAARRRSVARSRGDLAGEALAEQAIEASFRNRDRIVARVAELTRAQRPIDAPAGPVRQSTV